MCVFRGSGGGGLPFSTSELSAPEITLCSPESDGEDEGLRRCVWTTKIDRVTWTLF